jgi:signal transduction histidine kinase
MRFGAILRFDNHTAVIVGALAALSVSLLSALLLKTRRTYAGFKRWTAGNACAAASLIFLSLRGQIPDLASVAGTNAGAFAAGTLLLEGTREFLGLTPPSWPARIFAGMSLAVQLFFSIGMDNLAARILVASLCVGLLTFATAWMLFRSARKTWTFAFLFAGSCFTADAVLNLVRGIAAWSPWMRAGVFAPTLVNQVYFLGTTLSVVGWAFAFILLTNDRLIEDLTATEARTAALNRELKAATEQAMEAARRAGLADEAKSEFLAHMSHEIRNPLSGVMVLIELALEGPLTEEKRPDLESLQRSAQSVFGILDDILDLSKIEAGRLTLTPAPFDLAAEMAQIVDLFLPQAQVKSTILRLTYPLGLRRWFHGDRVRVRQIVSNFISNAVKFTGRGDVDLRVEQDRDGVKISVSDTGIGVPAEEQPRLFRRFTQASVSSGTQYRGTGLGLAISKQLAEMMGGHVGMSSEEGHGSTFWVQLPLTPSNPVHPDTLDGGVGGFDFTGLHVLVAEDHVVNQQSIAKLLEKNGLRVDVVGDGREAVARYSVTGYSMILMDCQMPDMDGCEATRRIRKMEVVTGRRTPVIAITANAMASEQDRCRRAGMDDYIVKPFAPEKLIECIASHLFGRKT